MRDLTVIYITANKMPEKWVEFQLSHLLKSIEDTQIISISRKPMNLGLNLLDEEPKSFWNLYMQLLRGAEIANTPYVAMAEDDTLYTYEHFHEFRPPMDKVSYDRSRWSLFVWDNMYCMRQRVSNCSLIAPRELLIEALTERKNKHPNGVEDRLLGEVGRDIVDRRLGVTHRGCIEWYCTNPIVMLNHPTGSDTGVYARVNRRRMVKKHGQIKAYDIPYWGKATDIIRIYNEGN